MFDKRLLKLLGDNKRILVYVVLFMILGFFASIAITASICTLIYHVFENKGMNSLDIFIGILLLAIGIRYVSSRKAGDLKDRLSQSVKKELREKIYQKVIKLGVAIHDEMSLAGLTQISIEGIEQLDLYYSTYIPQFFYSMIAPLLLFVICVWIDFKVALALLICVPLIPLSIIAVSKYAKKIFAKYWGKYMSMGDHFLDSVSGMKELKIFQADEMQNLKMNDSSEEFRKITMKVLVMQLASTTIMDFIAYGGAGLGIGLTIFSIQQNQLSPYAGLFLILVAVEFFLPLRAFGSAFHIAMNGVSAGNKILTLFEQKDPVWGNQKVEQYDITFDDVTFAYEENREILKHVSFTVPSIGFTSIVGESGSGKSTIINLILGGLRANKGHVKIGNVPLEKYSREDYYSHVTLVSYNTYLFNQSVRDNFKLANRFVSDEEIYNALKKVNLYEFILENGGLDKVIQEDAQNISGGQRQRLALAIALTSNKQIYLFDEATSNIDVESETIILSNIQELSKTKSVIFISHRFGNVVKSDMIYYIENGAIKEKGTHDELMNLNQGYANLYQTQKQLEEGYKVV